MNKETAFILGGSGKMGSATAQVLIEKGYQVIIAGRTESKLIAITEQLGANCSYAVVNASNEVELKKVLMRYADLDHIVAAVSVHGNAGGIYNTTTMLAQSAFQRFWINYSLLHLAPAVLKRNGSVTLLSGSSAKTPLKGYGVWGTLHGCINALVKQAAIELAPIRVNAISPGGIGLKPNQQLTEHIGQAEDIAQMIFAVISNLAVTASIIDVDGGERMGTWNG